jgi:hypothetical protein
MHSSWITSKDATFFPNVLGSMADFLTAVPYFVSKLCSVYCVGEFYVSDLFCAVV